MNSEAKTTCSGCGVIEDSNIAMGKIIVVVAE